ncbi:MAG: ArsR/SmtB family transcription factor [Kiloniellales bacterium]
MPKALAPTASAPALSADQIVELAGMFHLMGDPTRLGIIMACLEDEVSVGELARRLGLSASLTSHHLRLLRAARVLRGRRRGKQVFYGAADDHIRAMLRGMIEHVGEVPAEGEG